MNNNSFENDWKKRFERFGVRGETDASIAGWSETGLETRVRHFVAAWGDVAAGPDWADVGCGAGTYSRILKSHNKHVVAMDYSFPTILRAQEKDVADIGYCVSDVRRIPLKSSAVDGVLCFGVMQALSESDGAINELSRIVKPGGQVWIDALNIWCVANLWKEFLRCITGKPIRERFESDVKLKGLMRKHDLEKVKVYWLPILPGRLQSFQGLVEGKLLLSVFQNVPLLGRLFCHSILISSYRKHGS